MRAYSASGDAAGGAGNVRVKADRPWGDSTREASAVINDAGRARWKWATEPTWRRFDMDRRRDGRFRLRLDAIDGSLSTA